MYYFFLPQERVPIEFQGWFIEQARYKNENGWLVSNPDISWEVLLDFNIFLMKKHIRYSVLTEEDVCEYVCFLDIIQSNVVQRQ